MTLEQPFSSTDDFYEGESEVKYKLRHFGKFKILAFVTGVLAFLCILFIVLYAVEKNRARGSTASQGRPICDNNNCLFTSYGKTY
jgi:hypothetical protein